MTSVPNHRQPLSGNSRWLIIISLFIATACGAGRQVQSSASTSEVVPIQTPQKSQPSKDTTIKKLEPIDIEDEKTTPQSPTTFPGAPVNIAVILPFNLDQIPLEGYLDDTTKTLKGDPKNAIEFYLGCKLAKETFNQPKLTANVYFLDDASDSLAIFDVLKSKPFPNVQYIIGPMSLHSLKPVAEFGRKNKIPVISPITNSMYVTKDNPYYYNATPTIKTQYAFLVDELVAANPGKTVEIIYDGTDSLQENISFLKNILAAKSAYPNPTIGAKYYDLQLTDDIAKSLYTADTLSNRVVLIYSNKEAYVKALLAKMRPVKNKLNIYALPAIRNTKTPVDVKYPHSIFIAYPYFPNEYFGKVYADWFEENYNKKVTEYFYQGFDLMNMVFDQISKGKPFQEAGIPAHYNRILHTQFKFTPVVNKNNGTDYYENKSLYLLKYTNSGFVKVK